ncbi:MAG: signal recognition particle protein [Phycisphaerae bacterium]|nr:signal recognition particle protein [Phycisphaerae bacterium]
MFEGLTKRFQGVFHQLRGRGKITEGNVEEAMREVRTALLEADVHVQVVKQFCDSVLQKALGAKVIETLHPDQVMVKIVHDELIRLMGPVDPRIPFITPGPTIILMAGLQGSGKTTTCGKLAKYIMSKGKRPLMVAADLKRPAAIDQLEVIGSQVGVPVYTERGHVNAVKVARNSVIEARRTDRDVVIVDTAGRLAIDEELMNEIAQVEQAINPTQVYLVIDAMTGQDAVNTGKRFNERLELDALILTKFDSDTRGGAALSAKVITGKPIKFIGIGEKLENLEEFHVDRIAGRILGMGDVIGLVEKAQQQYDAEEAKKLEKKMSKGLDLEDFLGQMRKMKSMGSVKDIMKMVPGMSTQMEGMDIDESELDRYEAIIQSMTPKERRRPDIIEASRRRRIAKGSGTDAKDVGSLIKSFEQVRDMMKVMSGMSMMNRLKSATQFASMAARGISMRIKGGSSVTKRQLSQKDKRKQRKKRSR